MNQQTPFEKELLRSYALRPMHPGFANRLEAQLMDRQNQYSARPKPSLTVWAYAAAALVLLSLVTLAIGPGKVYAQLRAIFGYVPGAGLLDRSLPLRLLKEPVSQTREGVTLRVDEAVLSADRTWLRYHIFGLPLPADAAAAQGACTQDPYLQLADGTHLPGKAGIFPPLPQDLANASLILPCLPGSQAADPVPPWALDLEFIPAPADFQVHEVSFLAPEVTYATPLPSAEPNFGHLSTTTQAEIVLEQTIRTEDAYILDGLIRPLAGETGAVKIVSVPVIRDQHGNYLIFTSPSGLRENIYEALPDGSVRFAFELPMANTDFPITLEIPIKLVPAGALDQSQFPTAAATFTWAPDEAAQPQTEKPELVCVLNETLASAGTAPKTLKGTAYWQDAAGILYHSALDGSGAERLAPGSQVAVSVDGSQIAWADADGLSILSTADGQLKNFPTLQPMDMVWSPDGGRLALALDPNWPRRVILDPATGSQQSFDALSQERLAGFSADGNLIYLLIPGTRGDGSLVMSFDIQSQTYQELFYLNHRSAKGPKPVISADGNWLAYLGTPQGSIFIQPLDGGKATQVVDAPGRFNAPSAITKLIWTNTHQLAFDFYPAPQSPQSTWLLDPLSCALQQLPLEGSLLALRID